MAIIIKSNIKKTVKELQGSEIEITSISKNVELALERKTEELLTNAIKRAKANKRRTLHARDL